MGLPPIPQSPTCETPTVVSYVYLPPTGTTWFPYDPAAPPPASSIRQTTTMDGLMVPMIVRWERGVINRFMYSIMVLSPYSQTSAVDLRAWNRKALFSFSGGVAIGHYQGAASGGDMRHLAGLQMGYAVLYSSGTRTNTHYNLQLGGETAIMVKDRFVSAYAEPEYTIGVGASGGGIQQYVYGQNHAGPARRRRAAVLVLGHGHADDPRRRLRVARALGRLEGRFGSALDVANLGQPHADRRAQRLGGIPNP